MSDLNFVFWHWFVFAALLGAVEIIAPGVFFLWLAMAAFLTGVAALVVPSLSAPMQIVIFGVLAVIMVYAAWKYIKKNPTASDQPLLNQRTAQMVGKLATLETAIENGVGRIKLGDTTWKVEGMDMPAGTQVRVISSDGMVMKVEKA